MEFSNVSDQPADLVECRSHNFTSYTDEQIAEARKAAGIEVVRPFMAKTKAPPGAEILVHGGVVLGYKYKPRKQFDDRCFGSLRTRELDALTTYRHRSSPPSKAEARALATALASVADPERASQWIRKWCKSLDSDEQDEIMAEAAENPRKYTAAQFGELLKLTREERALLKITTFRAAGVTKKEMAAERKRKDAKRKRAKRAEARGDKPTSLAKRQPWREFGISRSTFYRWRRKSRQKHGHDVKRGDEHKRQRDTEIVRSRFYPLVQTDPVSPDVRPSAVGGGLLFNSPVERHGTLQSFIQGSDAMSAPHPWMITSPSINPTWTLGVDAYSAPTRSPAFMNSQGVAKWPIR